MLTYLFRQLLIVLYDLLHHRSLLNYSGIILEHLFSKLLLQFKITFNLSLSFNLFHHQYCKRITSKINSEKVVVMGQGEHFPANWFPFRLKLLSIPKNFWQADVEDRVGLLPLFQGQSSFARTVSPDFIPCSEFHELSNFLDFYETSDLLFKKLPSA